jgi:hypothetical protein
MTILYETGGNLSGLTSCYGSIYRYLPKDIDDFDGIKLFLSNKSAADDHPAYQLFLDKYKDDDESIRSILRMARDTGFSEYVPRYITTLKNRDYIQMSEDMPFFVVVALTGFFRAFNNHYNLIECYEYFRKRGIDPHISLAAAYTVSTRIKSDGTTEFYFTPHGEHSVIPWTMLNKGSIKKFKSWNKRMSELPSMRDELIEKGRLYYTGRDEWFGAVSSGNNTHVDEDTLEEDGIGIYGCETLNHLKKSYSDYETNVVDMDSLVAELKTWRV